MRIPPLPAWRHIIASVLFLLGLCLPMASAQTVDLGSYGGVFSRVTLTIFDNTRVVRGVVIGLENDFANTFSGDYSAMCWDQGFALVGVDVVTYPNAWDGSGQAILDKLHSAAISLNRPELDHVPFCVTGFSRGGDWSWSFAAMHPDRTIAFVSNKTSFFTNEATANPDILPSDPVFQLPAILNTGDDGLDAPTVTNVLEGENDGTPRFFNHHRPTGARYALTREMGAGHEIKNFNRMTGAFFGAMCRLRYPLSLDPLAGNPRLLPLPPESQGWLGDNAAYRVATQTRMASYAPAGSYAGTNALATNFTSYLATEDVAAWWRASISRTDTVSIDRGYGVQEGTVGTLTIHTDGYPGANRVDVYDGATLVGSTTTPTTAGGTTWQVGVTFHAPYQHVFYALVNGPNGKRTTGISPIYCQLNRPSRPATFAAAAQSGSSIQVTWSAVSIAEYYRLTRTLGGATTVVADVPAGATSYTDTGLASGTTYTYHMQVMRKNMWSWEDCSATATTLNGGGISSPVISSAGSAAGSVGQAFSYAIMASNTPTGFAVSGALPGGMSLNAGTGVISGTPTTAGTSTVTIAATNAGGTGTKTLVITIAPAAAVPTITSPGTASGTVGQAFTYTITATNGPTAFSVSGVLPPGLSLNTGTGVISGIPTTAVTSAILIAAGNASGANTANLTITIAPAASPAPVISSAGSAAGTVGHAFSYAITASNGPTGFAVSGTLPTGLALNNVSGVISGTPTVAGTSTVTIAATNAGGTGTRTLVITIAPAAAPAITSPGTASGTVGHAFTYTITATNGPTAFSVSGILPAGLSLNTGTGVISGTPTAAMHSAVLIAAGNASGVGAANLVITIAPATATAPVITSSGVASGTVGHAFTYAITATNGPTAFSASGVLPAGLSLNTGTGVISGTPTAAMSSAIQIAAGNASGIGVATLLITINPEPSAAPVISSASTVPGAVGHVFGYTISASNNPTGYAVTGTLPAGLALNNMSGVISGTPTVAGTSTVTIAATNTRGTGTKTLTISISATNRSPVATAPITTQVATLDQPYQFTAPAGTFADPDGDALVWSASGLPAWISFDPATRTFSGTPSRDDIGHPATITVQAADVDGAATSASFPLQVDEQHTDNAKGCGLGSGITLLLIGAGLGLTGRPRRRSGAAG